MIEPTKEQRETARGIAYSSRGDLLNWHSEGRLAEKIAQALAAEAHKAALEAEARVEEMREALRDAIALAVANMPIEGAEPVAPNKKQEEVLKRLGAVYASPPSPDRFMALREAATRYRQAEQDGTPRITRGKALHDLGLKLDDAIAAFEQPEKQG